MIRYKRTKRGRGIFDFFKPVMPLVNKAIENKDVIGKVASTAKDVVNIGKNTRDIIKEIKNKNQPLPAPVPEVEDIVNRINKLRTSGSGFAYI